MNPSTRIASTAVAVASTIALGGCASSLSGVGGTQSYACKAPIGAQCTSVSGVYANANANANASANASANANANSDLLASLAMHEALRPQGLLAMPFTTIPTLEIKGATSAQASSSQAASASASTAATPTTTALRSPPRVIRLWIAPWEDADGDLHDASFVHVVIDTGRWLIERTRPAPRSRIDIATPPLAVPLAPTAVPQTSPPADPAPIEP